MKMKLLDWSVFGCRRCVSCRVWSTELWPGVGARSAWWELFLSDRGGILPPSLPPPLSSSPSCIRAVRSDALQQLVWRNGTNTDTRARRLRLHENVQSGFENEVKLLHCDVWPRFQRSSQSAGKRPLCCYEFIKAAGCVLHMSDEHGDLHWMYGGNEVISIPLCVSFISLLCPPWLLQFQFIIRTPDELAPPLRLPSLLHSAEKLLQFAPFCCKPPSRLSLHTLPSRLIQQRQAVTLPPPRTQTRTRTISCNYFIFQTTADQNKSVLCFQGVSVSRWTSLL